MSHRLLAIALAATLATPAFAASRDEVKEAAGQLHAEVKLEHRFGSAQKAWERGYEKQKSGPMLAAGKKLTKWVDDAVEEIPRRVLRDARDGEDDSARTQYAEALLALRASLARNGGDGKPKVDATTHDLLREIHKALTKRVSIRKARLTRSKEELKAAKRG